MTPSRALAFVLLGAAACGSPNPTPPKPGEHLGGLSAKQVRDVVMAHIDQIRGCYESEATRSPTLKGKVTARWDIEPSGAVSHAAVAESTLASPVVETCIIHVIEGWRFPSDRSKTTIAGFPFKFGVADEASQGP